MKPFSIRVQPVWRDMDALGHVNNAVYSTWLENARDAFWRTIDRSYDRFPFLLARTEIDFRASVTWRDAVTVGVWVSRIGNASFDLAYTIDARRHVADARTVLVMYDHDARRSTPVTPALRKKLRAFEKS